MIPYTWIISFQISFIVNVTLTTKYWGNEISWSILDQNTCTTVCSSKPPGSYGWYSQHKELCSLEKGTTYKLHCKDTYGDGWHGGFITIQGIRYCDDFCPDPPYCYGPGQWDPSNGLTGGELFVQKNIEIRDGNNILAKYLHSSLSYHLNVEC